MFHDGSFFVEVALFGMFGGGSDGAGASPSERNPLSLLADVTDGGVAGINSVEMLDGGGAVILDDEDFLSNPSATSALLAAASMDHSMSNASRSYRHDSNSSRRHDHQPSSYQHAASGATTLRGYVIGAHGQRRPFNRPVGVSKRHVPYLERERIGQGAFGVVHKAVEEKYPSKVVAIKRMKSVRQGMGIPQDAYREIKILKEISRFPHENIVKLERVYMSKDSNDHSAMLNLVYSYAEHDLAEIIRHHRSNSIRISQRMIKSIMWQLLQGLNFLHQNWIIHRDISKCFVILSVILISSRACKYSYYGQL
jgi:hypothetical protein